MISDSLLSPDRAALVADLRAALAGAESVLARSDAPAEDRETLRRSVRQLDEPFMLVVVGEFNSGKSALINALVGARILEEGVTPTTSRVGCLRHADQRGGSLEAEGVAEITAEVELLRQLVIVDTPGTNAVLREHEALTREFVPRSDLVLFVTSADRPFSESERGFLETLRDWGKPIVVVVNKADLLESAQDRERVATFVGEQSRTRLQIEPDVHLVSARRAMRARLGESAQGDLESSGLPELERGLTAKLTDAERFRVKLSNPLGIGKRLLSAQRERIDAAVEVLAADLEVVDSLEEQLALHHEDVGRQFRFRLADVDNVLLDFERRGEEYFDDTLRLGRVLDLLNPARIKAEFEREVVGDLPRSVEHRVGRIVDWMIEGEQRQWQAMMRRLEERQSAHADRLPGASSAPLDADRRERLGSVQREAQRVIETYDRDAESSRLASQVRDAVAGAALLQAGAVGLGTVVTLLASTTLADVTGVLAAGSLSVLGLLAIPRRRRAARQDLRLRVGRLRRQLMTALTSEFERERDASAARLSGTVAPYTRFVQRERDELDEQRRAIDMAQRELRTCRDRLERV